MSRLRALSMRETHSGGARQFQRVLSNATTSSFADRATFEVLASSAGCVTSMALEPVEGRVLLTTDTRSVVRLYDGDAAAGNVNSGGGRPLCPTPLASYCHFTYAHSRAITTCAWYPRDGGLFVTGGADGCCVVWDPGLRGGGGITPVSKMDLFPPSTYPNASSASSSSSAAAAAASAGSGGGGRVHSVSMSPCASTHALVAVGTESPGVRLLDLATGAAIHSLPGHTDAVMTVAWCPFNEHLLASGARDGVLLLHDVRRSGSLAVLAALDAHTVERQWLDYIGKGGGGGGGGGGFKGGFAQQQQQAPGGPSIPKLPASARASLGIAFRGERQQQQQQQQQYQEGGGNNPSRDAIHAPSIAHAGKLGSGVNGLLWISPPTAAPGGAAPLSKTAQFHLVSTGGDSEVRLWGLTGVESSPPSRTGGGGGGEESPHGSTFIEDPGNLITHRGITGLAGWNTLKTFSGVKNCAKRCIGMAGTTGVVGGGFGGGRGGLGGVQVPPRVLKMEGGQGGEVWDTRERWGRGCGRDLLFHPIILPKVSANTTAAAGGGGGRGGGASGGGGGAVRFVSGRLNGGGGSGGGDLGGIGVWDASSGENLGRLKGGHLANVSALVWAGGMGWGGTLFSGGDDGLVLRWRVASVASGGGQGSAYQQAMEADTEEEEE